MTIFNCMVDNIATPLDMTLAALADPTRRAIFSQLADGASPVSRLAEPYDMSLNAVSKHIKILERAGLVRRERRGRVHMIEATPHALEEAAGWFDAQRRFWASRLDRLEALMRAEDEGGDTDV